MADNGNQSSLPRPSAQVMSATVADVVDLVKFGIITINEARGILGRPKIDDARADALNGSPVRPRTAAATQ